MPSKGIIDLRVKLTVLAYIRVHVDVHLCERLCVYKGLNHRYVGPPRFTSILH